MLATIAFKKIKDINEDVVNCLSLINPKIKPKKVLIKPNLLQGGRPGSAVCTNVHVLSALVEWLEQKGKEVTMADGSVFINTMEEFKRAGYDKLAIKFVDLNNDKYVKAKVKNALEWSEIEVAKTFYDAEYIINVPVAKCHHLAGVTLGIKNLMGVLKPLGDPRHGVKAHIHREWDQGSLPDKEAKELFERRLIDLLRVKKIDLTLIDGSYGLQKYESSSLPIKTDFLIASQDIIAADILCSEVMGFSPANIYYLQVAQKVLGKREIKAIGDKLEKFKFKKSPMWSSLVK